MSEIEGKHRYLDIAVYFTIRCFKCDNTSRISYEKIVDKLGITKKDAIKAVKEMVELKIISYKQIPSEHNSFKFNEYYFDKELDQHFEMVGRDLLEQNLKAKQIGLLIYLKLDSLFGWYRFRDYTELGKKLGCTRQTASKYIKELSDYIEPSKAGGIHFTNKIFTFKDKQERTKQTYIL